MSLLLLKNVKQCPACRSESVPTYLPSQCRNCKTWLFLLRHDFNGFERQTGWREYWAFCSTKGWVHRSHLMDKTAKPLERVYVAPKLDDDYGTPEYQKRQLENAPERVELKKEYKRLRKKPVTVRKTQAFDTAV